MTEVKLVINQIYKLATTLSMPEHGRFLGIGYTYGRTRGNSDYLVFEIVDKNNKGTGIYAACHFELRNPIGQDTLIRIKEHGYNLETLFSIPKPEEIKFTLYKKYEKYLKNKE